MYIPNVYPECVGGGVGWGRASNLLRSPQERDPLEQVQYIQEEVR